VATATDRHASPLTACPLSCLTAWDRLLQMGRPQMAESSR